jgi:hypothetical protein
MFLTTFLPECYWNLYPAQLTLHFAGGSLLTSQRGGVLGQIDIAPQSHLQLLTASLSSVSATALLYAHHRSARLIPATFS